MKIILGVFSYQFSVFSKQHGLESYNWKWEEIEVNEHYEYGCIIKQVHFACLMADEIYFDLTLIKNELTDNSFSDSCTINELLLVITDESYLAKTKFFRDGIEIPKDEVVNWFLFNDYWNQFLV